MGTEGCDSLPRRRDPCRVYMGRPHRDFEDEKAARTKPDIVAISGTSAGALCALATWYGLVANTADPECGTIDKAVERLDFLWTTFAATTPVELVHNQMVGSLLHWKSKGAPFSGSNPYDVSGNLGLAGLSMMGARREYLEFPALLRSLCPHFETVDWPRVAKADLRIPRRGHRGSQRQLRGLRFRQKPREQRAAYRVICPEGLSLWLRHCPHLVTNGPLEPVFSPPPTAPEATA